LNKEQHKLPWRRIKLPTFGKRGKRDLRVRESQLRQCRTDHLRPNNHEEVPQVQCHDGQEGQVMDITMTVPAHCLVKQEVDEQSGELRIIINVGGEIELNLTTEQAAHFAGLILSAATGELAVRSFFLTRTVD